MRTPFEVECSRMRQEKSMMNLNNHQLLHVSTRSLLLHAVPGGVGEYAADGPHDWDGGFGGG